MPPWAVIITVVLSCVTLALTMVVLYHKAILWLGDRLTTFETMLQVHAQQIAGHVRELEDHRAWRTKSDQRHLDLAADLQRLIGRSEALFRGVGVTSHRKEDG